MASPSCMQQRFINPNTLTQQQQHQLQQIQEQHSNNDYSQFIKRQQQQQQQHSRRFSYTSMLSDADPCYMATNSSPSNDSEEYVQQDTPPSSSVSPVSVTSFIDPIYVDIQTKGTMYHPMMMDRQQQQQQHQQQHHHHQQQQQIHYYDPHQKNFSSSQNNNNNAIFHRNSMMHFPSSMNNNIAMNKNISRPVTPVSPPLILKDNYPSPNNVISSPTATNPATSASSASAAAAAANNKIKKTPRSRGRRVSNIPGCNSRMFTCKVDACGKVFKRSEHLKRHIRSIHTLEKRKVFF